jgi:hypothetical protein
MAISENLYRQLGRLIETMPDLKTCDITSPDVNQWLGRAYALVKETGDLSDLITLKMEIGKLGSTFPLEKNSAISTVHSIIYRALAIAELAAPAGTDGTFIPVGNSFDAFSAVSKILTNAKKDVFIIDPYMDEVTLTEFGTAVPENIKLRLMADQKDYKPTLIPAAQKWISQYNTSRPLNVRLAAPRTLHDRAIFIDGTTAYTLTQSLNAFAKRSPAEIIRADDTAQLKIAAYEEIWANSEVLI